MFTFQSIMFVSLGFLCALLLGFVVAPAFWARAVRLTTERMRASLPLTEREINAERDRLRAENAIRVHQLTSKIEQARLYDARQKVEINRREGTISTLQRRLEQIETEREGSENARRVLEATISQRVPEVESRLLEARQLLARRDAEMKALKNDTAKTFRALDDAMQVNAQQRAEIDRLKMSQSGNAVMPPSAGGAAEAETVLRAELEVLRARSREQAAQITRLQKAGVSGGVAVSGSSNGVAMAKDARRGEAALIPLKPVVANDDEGWESPEAANAAGSGNGGDRGAEIVALQTKIAEQAGSIETLKAHLATYEQDIANKGRSLSLRDSKTVLKSRLSTLEREIGTKEKAIAGLRRELATANERIARQASYYQDELRRLGSRHGAANVSNGEDKVEDAVSSDETETAGPPPLPNVVPDAGPSDSLPKQKPPAAAKPQAAPSLEARLKSAANAEPEGTETGGDFDQHVAWNDGPAEAPKPETRGKLMDRIAGLAKR